jgi:hypothetical protein
MKNTCENGYRQGGAVRCSFTGEMCLEKQQEREWQRKDGCQRYGGKYCSNCHFKLAVGGCVLACAKYDDVNPVDCDEHMVRVRWWDNASYAAYQARP